MAPNGDRLRVTAPRGAITPELKAAMTEHKTELLALVGGQPTPAPEVISPKPGDPPWTGATFKLDELEAFKDRWGLRLLALTWAGDGPAVGVFMPAEAG